MKILVVSPVVSVDAYRNADYLPHALARRGHEIVSTAWIRGDTVSLIPVEERFRVCLMPGVNIQLPPGTVNPFILNLDCLITKSDCDIVHVNQLFKLHTISALLFCRRTHKPLVVMIHGVISSGSPLTEFIQRNYYRTFGALIFKAASKIICLTQADAKEVQKLGCKREKICIVKNGVDIRRFKPCNVVNDNLVFWGGRFVKQKGLEYLIEAFSLVKKEKPEVKLMMTGDGPLFPKISRMLKQLGLEETVIFKGRVSRELYPKLIGAASVYVLPSIREGMPYALLEAMASGKAVVGSDIPGINDIITSGEDGIIVPPRNPKALAKEILGLLNNVQLRNSLGDNARKLMVEKYSWDLISERMERVYEEARTL